MQKLKQKQQEEELLASFRAMDEKTKSVILSFARDQASRHPAKSHGLSVILGGRNNGVYALIPKSVPRKI